VEKAAEMAFAQKTSANKVDEIDTWGQFHRQVKVQLFLRRSQKHKKD